MSRFINIDDPRNCYIGMDGEYETYNIDPNVITEASSVHPERLSDDDFETIRIHLSAFKERLGNQRRWKEAEDYQRLIDRFMAFAEQAERKKDTIQKFHDYQVEWLLSHYDLELEPQLEEWVVRFLHDTANCYMMEVDREEGGQE